MRHISRSLVLVLILACPCAHATLIQIDAQGAISERGSDWLSDEPLPTMFHTSFIIDTLSATSQFYRIDLLHDGQRCLTQFSGAGMAVSNFEFVTDGA